MCGTCGCGSQTKATVTNLQTGATTSVEHDHEHDHHGHGHEHVRADGTRYRHTHHDYGHSHDHGHAHSFQDDAHIDPHVETDEHTHRHHAEPHVHSHHPGAPANIVELETRLLAKNDALAARNRAWFVGREILALNLVSSPGAGKTSLLERTIRDLKDELSFFVIEGDQETDADGERIRRAGAPAVQVNTGTGCHLEADMVARGIAELRPSPAAILMIENVGNLVCPALFDLGERAKVVVLSVTEGDDKPLKYPHMFRAAEIMLLNKIDLLPHVDFDPERCIAHARSVNPDITSIQLSARTGDGLGQWYDWLRVERTHVTASAFSLTGV